MTLPLPQITFFNGFGIIDDSEIGSKYRYLEPEIADTKLKHIFAMATGWGASEDILTRICSEQGKQLHLVYPLIPGGSHSIAKQRAMESGVDIISPPTEDLIEAKAIALEKADKYEGKLISLSNQKLLQSYRRTAQSLRLDPEIIYTASSSGTLCRGLQMAWREATHKTLVVLRLPHANMGKASVHYSNQELAEISSEIPPFRCNLNFEGKMWEWMQKNEKPNENAFLWNSAGPN